MNPLTITALLKASRPLDVIRHGPEEREIRCETDGPSLIVLSELADPESSAGSRKVRPPGRHPAPLRPVEPGSLAGCRNPGTRPLDFTIILSGARRLAGDRRFGRGRRRVARSGLAIRTSTNPHNGRRIEMTGVAIVGASGYASRELFRILANHPGAKITVATSRG